MQDLPFNVKKQPVSALLEELAAGIRNSDASKVKYILAQFTGRARFGPQQLQTYHDVLLRLAAFPDDLDIQVTAETELTHLFSGSHEPQSPQTSLASLEDSGIAGTDLTATFSLSTTRWLLEQFGTNVDLDWHQIEYDSAFDGLRELLVGHVTRDSVRAEAADLEQWCQWAAGPTKTPLAWIMERLTRVHPEPDLADYLFDHLELPVRWRLIKSSRTFQRFPKRPLCHDHSGKFDFVEELSKPIPKPQRLGKKSKQALIDLGRSILAVRHRETEALTYPNVNEVSLFNFEHGIDVALYGMDPLKRLPLESFFGFVAARNRVPIAYGGGFVFFDRCDIGLNIFDAFRGLESARVFSGILRAFIHTYRINTVRVDSAQFGYGRPGGIKSGAFWFYYNLGFRPEDDSIAVLARDESLKKKQRPSYRSGAATLRKLTESNLILKLSKNPHPVPHLSDIGAYVLQDVGLRFAGDPGQAERWSKRHLGKVFGHGLLKSATHEQLVCYRRMAPLIGSIPALASWTRQDKKLLLEIMLAKGDLRERDYVLKMQKHNKLRKTLLKIAKAA